MRYMAFLFAAFHAEKTTSTSMGARVLLRVLVLYDSPSHSDILGWAWFYLVSACALKNVVCVYVQYQYSFVGLLSLRILATLESQRTLVYRLHISLTLC